MAEKKEKRYKTTWHGYTIQEIHEGGALSEFHSDNGCVWDDAPESVHLLLQSELNEVRKRLHDTATETEKKRKKPG